MTSTKPERPSLASFWHDLPRDGMLLLSVVVFQFIGTGLVLPFWVVYLYEVRGFGLDGDRTQIRGKLGIEPVAVLDLDTVFRALGYRRSIGA